jgi:hypothetical protein
MVRVEFPGEVCSRVCLCTDLAAGRMIVQDELAIAFKRQALASAPPATCI